MSHNVTDYVGTYYVTQAQNTVSEVEGVTIEGDLSPRDEIKIDWDQVDLTTAQVTITSQDGTVILDEVDFIIDNKFGCLRGDNLDVKGHKFQSHVMLISRYEEPTVDGTYKAIYGAVIKKDPDSVGAWGADDNPPGG